MDVLQQTKEAFLRGNFEISIHAHQEMEQEHITDDELLEAIAGDSAEIIEDYPEDTRGHSCLIYGSTGVGNVIHVVVGFSAPIKLVTAYRPG